MGALRRLWPWVGVLMIQVGCAGMTQGLGKDLGTGLMQGINPQLPETGKGLLQGINQELPNTGKGLLQGINQELPNTGKGLMQGVGDGLRNDVLTDATNERLVKTLDAAGDSATRKAEQLTRVLDHLLATLGMRSEQISRGLMRGAGQGLGNDVLTDENQRKLDTLVAGLTGTARDQLVGPRTHDELVLMVKDVLGQVGSTVDDQRAKLQAALQDAEARFRNAIIGLIVLVLVAGAVIAFIVMQWKRHERLVQLLTLQIDRVPDEPTREALKHQIQDLATVGGLEVPLRKQLQKQGLLKGSGGANEPPRRAAG